MSDLRACRMGDFVNYTCPDKPPRPGPFIQGSFNTFVNNRPQVRLGDNSVPGPAVTGSSTTFVNNRPAVRPKDEVICGQILGGSFNTFIN